MYREIAKLIMYGDMDEECILYQIGEIFRRYEEQTSSKPALIKDIYTQLKRLLIVATDYGFNYNLWHNYLTFFLVTNENPFSITCEKVGANDGSVNKAFRIKESSREADVSFVAINNMDKVMLDDLIGYEIQKKKLIDNTKAFVEGRKANNVLLFGDSGTGKSTSIKAIVNAFYSQGLRMIEIYKHQFKDLSNVIAQIKNRNYRFIIYMDDLSFEEFETEYKFLKAVIEGGVETKPENILIYATSNRRHLIKETWNDRSDVKIQNGMHQSDTMEEKLSLVNRFGVTINYSKPSQKEYFNIVTQLAHRQGITMSDEELRAEANKWELSHGGISGRTAQQFVNYLAGFDELPVTV